MILGFGFGASDAFEIRSHVQRVKSFFLGFRFGPNPNTLQPGKEVHPIITPT
jgi:hypothetical protein